MRELAAVATCLALLACGPPPVQPTADPQQSAAARMSRIEGTVVANTRARGNAVVFLYRANNPPPPAGSGRPVGVVFVPEAQLFAGAASGSNGPFVASFTFSLVPPGQYLIQGFIDRNGCEPPTAGCRPPDFIPFYAVTNQPDMGDVGGAAVDPLTSAPLTVSIPDNLQPATGVSVSFADAATVPYDPPAFTVAAADAVFNPALGPLVLELDPATPTVNGVAVTPGLPLNGISVTPGIVVQYVKVVNGVAQDVNGDGVPDFWPRVVVRKVNAANPLRDENVDTRGQPLATPDATYAHQDPALDGQAAQVVLAAGIPPEDVTPSLTDGTGRAVATPTLLPRVHVVIQPLALDVLKPGSPAPLMAVPPGLYAVYLLQRTGQAWRVPNELGPQAAGALGFTPVTGQGFLVQVP